MILYNVRLRLTQKKGLYMQSRLSGISLISCAKMCCKNSGPGFKTLGFKHYRLNVLQNKCQGVKLNLQPITNWFYVIIKLWDEGFEQAWHHFAWVILNCLMSIRPTFLILTLFIPKIHISIESRRRGPAFAFPPAGAWLYFIRSSEYWSDGVLE